MKLLVLCLLAFSALFAKEKAPAPVNSRTDNGADDIPPSCGCLTVEDPSKLEPPAPPEEDPAEDDEIRVYDWKGRPIPQ